MSDKLLTVVETHEYLRAAKQAKVTDTEREAIVAHFAANPGDGEPLGSGLYKTRIARKGGGKSGGYRVIQFYRHAGLPVFLLTIYAKSGKDNFTPTELKAMTGAADSIATTYGGKNHE